jgi:hypothetical protein
MDCLVDCFGWYFAVVQIKPQIVPQVKSELQSANNQIQPYVYLIKANIEKKLSGQRETTTEKQVGKATTPTEEPLQGMTTPKLTITISKTSSPISTSSI